MRRSLLTVLLLAMPALAQPAPPVRVKATLVGVSGSVITIRPLADGTIKPGADVPIRAVTLLPDTRFVESHKGAFTDIKPGDYVGAAVSEGRTGLHANEVFLYDPALRGSGEGRFTDHDKLLVNGTVRSVQPSSPTDTNDGSVILHYRGATLTPRGKAKPVCEGRATPAPFASALACEADAVVEIGSGTPVSALTVGGPELLVPGRIVTVTIARASDRDVAPGVIVERPLEKPQSAH